MSLPLLVTLRYLARELEARIPEDCLERLEAEAMRTGRLAQELALFGAWAGPGAKLPTAVGRSRRWRDKAFIIGWRLMPSPASVAAAGRIRSTAGWAAWYLGRPVRFVTRRLRTLLGGPAIRGGAGANAPTT